MDAIYNGNGLFQVLLVDFNFWTPLYSEQQKAFGLNTLDWKMKYLTFSKSFSVTSYSSSAFDPMSYSFLPSLP